MTIIARLIRILKVIGSMELLLVIDRASLQQSLQQLNESRLFEMMV